MIGSRLPARDTDSIGLPVKGSSERGVQSKVRILFLIRQLGRGGAERQLVELVRGINRERFEITVGTFYDGGPLWDEMASISDIRLVSLKKKGRWDIISFGLHICRLVKEVRPQLTHGYMGFANEVGLIARILCGSRVVWGIRGSGCDYDHYQDWLRGFGHRIGAWLSRSADLIITNSEAGRREHIQEGYCGDRMLVVYNGIDTARFHPDREAGMRLRCRWGISLEAPLIGMAARLDPMKDHSTFIQAASLVARQCPEARFICFGSGPQKYRERLKTIAAGYGISERLIWMEGQSEMRGVYNALSFLTSTSSFGEGFSNVIGEAMACERLVVATDVGDAANIIDDSTLVVPPRRPEALAAAWLKLLDEKGDDLAAREAAARERIVTNFSVARLVNQTEEALLKTIQ